jgi:hypothetical protein
VQRQCRPQARIAAIIGFTPRNVYHAGEAVRQDRQRHLGCNLRHRAREEVRRAHASLDRTEGMLDGVAPPPHSVRIGVEAPLHSFEYVLILGSRDAPLLPSGADSLQYAAATSVVQ